MARTPCPLSMEIAGAQTAGDGIELGPEPSLVGLPIGNGLLVVRPAAAQIREHPEVRTDRGIALVGGGAAPSLIFGDQLKRYFRLEASPEAALPVPWQEAVGLADSVADVGKGRMLLA